MMITDKHYDAFLLALDEERFYDAHEVLEELWFPLRFKECSEVKLLKGFINASVSFELMKKAKVKQSKQVWKNYLKYRQLLFKQHYPKHNMYYKISLHIDKIYKLNHRKSCIYLYEINT